MAFREAPQLMRDNIIRQHGWRVGVCSRLREAWFGVAALSSIVAVNLKLFHPAQSHQGKVSVVDDEGT